MKRNRIYILLVSALMYSGINNVGAQAPDPCDEVNSICIDHSDDEKLIGPQAPQSEVINALSVKTVDMNATIDASNDKPIDAMKELLIQNNILSIAGNTATAGNLSNQLTIDVGGINTTFDLDAGSAVTLNKNLNILENELSITGSSANMSLSNELMVKTGAITTIETADTIASFTDNNIIFLMGNKLNIENSSVTSGNLFNLLSAEVGAITANSANGIDFIFENRTMLNKLTITDAMVTSGNLFNRIMIHTSDMTSREDSIENYNPQSTMFMTYDELSINNSSVTSGNLSNEIIIDNGDIIIATYPDSDISSYDVKYNFQFIDNKLSIANSIVNIDSDDSITSDFYATNQQFVVTAGNLEIIGSSVLDENNINIFSSIFINTNEIIAQDNTLNFNGTIDNGSIYLGHVKVDLQPFDTGIYDITDSDVYIGNNSISVTNNRMIIGSTAKFVGDNTSLYGGYLDYNVHGDTDYTKQIENGNITYDLFTGNTLQYELGGSNNFKTVANFEKYEFKLNPNDANTNKALINAENIIFGTNIENSSDYAETSKRSSIEVIGIASGKALQAGDKFILLRAENMSGEAYAINRSSVKQAQQGISLIYDLKTEVDLENKEATATILACLPDEGCIDRNDGKAAKVNPQLKSLSEGYLAMNQLVLRGADLIADEAFTAMAPNDIENGFVPFTIMSGQYNRYNSGSHINSKDFLAVAGIRYHTNNVILGAFVEGAWGKYDTHNDFENANKVKGDGDARYYGLGVLGRYDFDNALYTDGSLRFGRTHNKFHTDDIQNSLTGEFAKYTTKSNYISAHIGLGYKFLLDEQNDLDLSAKYLWSKLSGDSVTVASDPIKFDRINSQRIRINAVLNHQYNESTKFFGGVGYEYEFDGRAKATTYDTYKIDAPTVRGSTGLISLGAIIQPTSNRNLSFEFKAEGYVGKRRGGKGSITFKYAL